jgi:hypothetical protein
MAETLDEARTETSGTELVRTEPGRRALRRLEPEERTESRMSGWSIFGIAVGVVAAAALAMNMRDIIRYFRIRNM